MRQLVFALQDGAKWLIDAVLFSGFDFLEFDEIGFGPDALPDKEFVEGTDRLIHVSFHAEVAVFGDVVGLDVADGAVKILRREYFDARRLTQKAPDVVKPGKIEADGLRVEFLAGMIAGFLVADPLGNQLAVACDLPFFLEGINDLFRDAPRFPFATLRNEFCGDLTGFAPSAELLAVDIGDFFGLLKRVKRRHN